MNNQYAERTITCESCGQTVTGHMRPNQRYCTLDCYRKSKRPQRMTGENHICSQCGSQVYIPRNRVGLSHYFCCIEHANEWQGRDKTTHTCKVCGKEFRWSPSRHKANNITYCSLWCRDADPIRRTMLIDMNATQQRMATNKPERALYDLMDELGIPYFRQHVIGGKFCVDAFIPMLNTVIQMDGDYWHGNTALFPTPDARQRKRMALDVSQDAYMKACGYDVIRIWASELQRDRERVIAKLLPLATQQ